MECHLLLMKELHDRFIEVLKLRGVIVLILGWFWDSCLREFIYLLYQLLKKKIVKTCAFILEKRLG